VLASHTIYVRDARVFSAAIDPAFANVFYAVADACVLDISGVLDVASYSIVADFTTVSGIPAVVGVHDVPVFPAAAFVPKVTIPKASPHGWFGWPPCTLLLAFLLLLVFLLLESSLLLLVYFSCGSHCCQPPAIAVVANVPAVACIPAFVSVNVVAGVPSLVLTFLLSMASLLLLASLGYSDIPPVAGILAYYKIKYV
jgi:hypothetical protein